MKWLWLVLILALAGCSNRPAVARIPSDCVKVRITDFTKPCTQLKDGDLMCDAVKVHVNCVSAK